MGCRKLTYYQEPAFSASWKIFSLEKEKNVSGSKFCIDYYTFGMQMPGRNGSTGDYRYGFQGQEMDDEVKGEGNSYDFGNRMHDPRVGRFLSIDRYANKSPRETPYGFASNMPIIAIDINGDSTYLIIAGAGYENYTKKGVGHDLGTSFMVNAQALKKKIESNSTFDPSRDEIVIVYAPSTQRFVDAVNKEYKSGKIASLTVFSHGYSISNTNGTSAGGISLGGEMPGEVRDDGSIVSQSEANNQLNDYQSREINDLTVYELDRSNFESNARATLYGCFLGGRSSWSDDQIEAHSFGQRFANYLNISVKSFTGGGGGSMKVNSEGKNVYDGEMTRFTERETGEVKQSTFNRNEKPKIVR